MLSNLPVAEQELSRLLNNVKIVRGSHHRTVLANHYLTELWRLVGSIKRCMREDLRVRLDADLSDVHVVVEWYVLKVFAFFLGKSTSLLIGATKSGRPSTA